MHSGGLMRIHCVHVWPYHCFGDAALGVVLSGNKTRNRAHSVQNAFWHVSSSPQLPHTRKVFDSIAPTAAQGLIQSQTAQP